MQSPQAFHTTMLPNRTSTKSLTVDCRYSLLTIIPRPYIFFYNCSKQCYAHKRLVNLQCLCYSNANSINGCVGAVLFRQQKIDMENKSLFSALFRERRFFYCSK